MVQKATLQIFSPPFLPFALFPVRVCENRKCVKHANFLDSFPSHQDLGSPFSPSILCKRQLLSFSSTRKKGKLFSPWKLAFLLTFPGGPEETLSWDAKNSAEENIIGRGRWLRTKRFQINCPCSKVLQRTFQARVFIHGQIVSTAATYVKSREVPVWHNFPYLLLPLVISFGNQRHQTLRSSRV